MQLHNLAINIVDMETIDSLILVRAFVASESTDYFFKIRLCISNSLTASDKYTLFVNDVLTSLLSGNLSSFWIYRRFLFFLYPSTMIIYNCSIILLW